MNLILLNVLIVSALALPVDTLGAETATNSTGMKLVRIEPGSFLMGQDGPAADYNVKKHAEKFDDADWDEKPAHKVTIGTAFHIGATEVTLGQYRQFQPKHAGGRGADDDAVTGVSWNDAVAFDEGKTWPHRRLVTPGGAPRTVNGIDRGQFTLSPISAEPQGYLAATQTRDGRVQLIPLRLQPRVAEATPARVEEVNRQSLNLVARSPHGSALGRV
jgi:hypothetical protein